MINTIMKDLLVEYIVPILLISCLIIGVYKLYKINDEMID